MVHGWQMAPVAAVGRAELHGHKRRADDELEGEQPLTKKFNRLRIGMSVCPTLQGR